MAVKRSHTEASAYRLAVPDPTVPVLSVVLVAVGALVFVNLLASRRPRRRPYADRPAAAKGRVGAPSGFDEVVLFSWRRRGTESRRASSVGDSPTEVVLARRPPAGWPPWWAPGAPAH